MGLRIAGNPVALPPERPLVDCSCDPVTVTVKNGQSLSDAADLGFPITALKLIIPTITTAPVTFQVSDDGDHWYELWDTAGEIGVTTSTGEIGTAVVEFGGWQYWKVRTGTASIQISQGADRTFGLLVEPQANTQPPGGCSCHVTVATISSGSTLSDGVDLGFPARNVKFLIPTLTNSTLSFQVSEDVFTWYNYHDIAGAVVVASSTGGMGFTVSDPAGWRHWKVKTSNAQSAERKLSLVVETGANVEGAATEDE